MAQQCSEVLCVHRTDIFFFKKSIIELDLKNLSQLPLQDLGMVGLSFGFMFMCMFMLNDNAK